MDCCNKSTQDSCGECKQKILHLQEQISLLTSELRDTNKKTRSKLDFLLKRIQDLEEKSINNT